MRPTATSASLHAPRDLQVHSGSAPIALAAAIAAVQPDWRSSAPMQIELDPGVVDDEAGTEPHIDAAVCEATGARSK